MPYGTNYIVVAGLLNVIAAVDAYHIVIGKKQCPWNSRTSTPRSSFALRASIVVGITQRNTPATGCTTARTASHCSWGGVIAAA